jgi:2-oxo-4-hydroxy-4-carboxy-5-ureidoimidazoline decarboxylase
VQKRVDRVAGRRWTLAEVNAWDRDAFVARLGGLFEGSPWIAAEAWAARPFGSREELHRAFRDAILRADEERQLALIRAHPDLVGRAALAGTLTRESTGEQRAAGLDPGRLTPEEIARFGELNATYKERFGFPFVICARENRKASILAGFQTRLGNDRPTEIATALGEIAKIGWYRLVDAVDEPLAASR